MQENKVYRLTGYIMFRATQLLQVEKNVQLKVEGMLQSFRIEFKIIWGSFLVYCKCREKVTARTDWTINKREHQAHKGTQATTGATHRRTMDFHLPPSRNYDTLSRYPYFIAIHQICREEHQTSGYIEHCVAFTTVCNETMTNLNLH